MDLNRFQSPKGTRGNIREPTKEEEFGSPTNIPSSFDQLLDEGINSQCLTAQSPTVNLSEGRNILCESIDHLV